jgi:hypothetical protein
MTPLGTLIIHDLACEEPSMFLKEIHMGKWEPDASRSISQLPGDGHQSEVGLEK